MKNNKSFLDKWIVDNYSSLVALYINWNVIKGIFDNLFAYCGKNNHIVDRISVILLCVLLFFLFIYFLKFILFYLHGTKLFFFCLVITSIFIVSVLYNNMSISLVIDAFRDLFLNVLLLCIIIYGLRNLESFYFAFKPFLIFAILYSVTEILKFSKLAVYDMNYSYQMLIPMLFCLFYSITTNRIKYFLLFSVFEIINVICGSRGSLLCHALCIMWILYYYHNRRVIRKTVAISLILLIFIFLLRSTILVHFSSILDYSRTFNLLLSGEGLKHMSGRNVIYLRIIKQIWENPFKIRGFYADRFFLSSFYSNVEHILGLYAHNFFLEILYQFGIWALIPLCYFIIKMIFHTHKLLLDKKGVIINLWIIACSYSIGQLLVSSSFLVSPSFGLLIGIYLNSSNKQKRVINENSNNLCKL